MLRTRLLTATAAIALFAAPAAFAQSTTTTAPETPAEMPATSESTVPAAAETPAPAATQTDSAETPATAGNIIDTLKAKGEFSTLLAALDNAQLTETLRTQPAISIFAPTDAAFAQLPEADRTRLMDPANAQELRQLLLYHVVVADVTSSQIEGTKGGVETAARTQVQLDGTGDAIKVDDATVTTADIDASNGSIFAIDKVLSPGASQVASG
ncbi:fasciclin domain-containing protein, partial [Brevundimonas sp.]|uniref:fasciclin domain-containing protein n=1 Tax=Brevundimonas sp. TaxID=1871086 RepID=UPI001A24507D